MEGGLLSRPEIIEASRKFVCVRLNATGSDDEARKLSLRWGRVVNVEFFLLDPAGEKALLRKNSDGLRNMGVFISQAGGPSGIASEMEKVARQYPGKAPEAPAIPWSPSLGEALVQAHCDSEPVLLVIADGTEASKNLAKLVGDTELLRRFRTGFFFAKLDPGSKEIAKYKLPQESGLLFLRPSRLGTEAVVMNTKAEPNDLAKSMAEALDEFGKTFPKLSRQETLEKGKSEKIHYPGADKSPGPDR